MELLLRFVTDARLKISALSSGLAANHDGAELKQLQETWTLIFRSDLVIADALQQARSPPLLPAAEHFCRFLEASTGQGRRGPMPVQGR